MTYIKTSDSESTGAADNAPAISKVHLASGKEGTVAYMKKPDVAKLLGGVSPRTISLWMAKYGLPYTKIRGVVIYSQKSVLEWAKAQERVCGQQKKGEQDYDR